MRTTRSNFPKMRAPVSTCTHASAIAAVANQAFDAIVEEKTDSMMSVYDEATLATNTVSRHLKVYDGRVSTPEPGWPLRRIVVLPLVLFAVVSASAFTLAKLHPAKPATASGPVTLGDAKRGQMIFTETCGGCHGMNAQGGIGPRLAGAQISAAAAKAQIDNGGGIMPAQLVSGTREDDVLAYLATIFAK
jgi:mono/diheme cytochrome c family protein